IVRSCKKLSYDDRLRFLEIPTLKYRRTRGDMIEVFKISNGFYDTNVAPILMRNYDTRTRGNDSKLIHNRCRLDNKKQELYYNWEADMGEYLKKGTFVSAVESQQKL